MKIKIALNTKGRELSNAIEAVNGKARSSTASAMDVLNATDIAEKQLAAFGIAKSSRIGAELIYIWRIGGSRLQIHADRKSDQSSTRRLLLVCYQHRAC